ncbi:MAG: hypothetical protein U5K51_03260 [Flavobacteriaceae bacterium]|nr:hypothetical protein [Flavobacteriaceae bacterium]
MVNKVAFRNKIAVKNYLERNSFNRNVIPTQSNSRIRGGIA